MPARQLDATGLRCPQPVMRIAATVITMKAGEVLEVVADCPTFEQDVKKWATRLRKTAIVSGRDGPRVTVQVQV